MLRVRVHMSAREAPLTGPAVQEELARQGRYVYAHEIPGGQLMALAERMRQPRYFLNNAQDVCDDDGATPEKLLRHTHFPSFFFGAAGSSSPLHSDGAADRLRALIHALFALRMGTQHALFSREEEESEGLVFHAHSKGYE